MSALAAPAVAIGAEPADQPDVRAFVDALNAEMLALYPREVCHHLTVEQMAQPQVTTFVARDDAGRALAMGSLRRLGDGMGEVKRMYVPRERRGEGLGKAVLARIVKTARAEGLAALVLETAERQPEAIGLYERAGFSRRGPFADYPDHPMTIFMEKRLETPA